MARLDNGGGARQRRRKQGENRKDDGQIKHEVEVNHFLRSAQEMAKGTQKGWGLSKTLEFH